MSASRSHRVAAALTSTLLAVLPSTATAWEAGGAVFIKGGVMWLQDDSQVLEGAGRTPVNVDINTRSAKTLNIGWELRLPYGLAVGTEFLSYDNRFTPQGSMSFGTASTEAFLVTGKKYFFNNGVVRPYVGGGIGAGFTHVDNARTGGTVDNYDFAALLHALVGVELRIDHLSVLLEARALGYAVDTQKADLDPSAASVLLGVGINW